MNIRLHQGDLPDGLDLGASIAIDTETMGLNPHRDRLCLVQLSAGDGHCHLVRIPPTPQGTLVAAPNLKRLLSDARVIKLFHFARFDIASLKHALGVMAQPIYCTKTASRLVRTFTDRHGLKDLCRTCSASSQERTTDFRLGRPTTQEQLRYAATDVVHLRPQDQTGRNAGPRGPNLAQACFDFLPRGRNSIWPAGRRSISSPIDAALMLRWPSVALTVNLLNAYFVARSRWADRESPAAPTAPVVGRAQVRACSCVKEDGSRCGDGSRQVRRIQAQQSQVA
jgi:ribonuclease D